jgi:valyl-tRNA synthetase
MKFGGVGKKEKKDKPLPNPPNPEKPKEKKEKEKKIEQIYTDSTPVGQFKQIEGFFPETYQPAYVEAAWQSWWEKSGFYSPSLEKGLDADEADKFVMVIPPPNVTGSLHLGHALMSTIEDTLTRWHRMNGKITLWLPGVDHAGIATQSVVERMLMKTEKKTRHELGRETFVNKVWEWKEKYGNRITTQLRYLGASVDWTREAFTMDPKLSKAVNEAFVRFYEDGLLYRDTRLINWSCALQSALSDIEVEFLDLKEITYLSVPGHTAKEKYEFGTLTSFAYKVADSDNDEEIIVATTRLETMLGDTGVAVHPDDNRYKHLHGKFLLHPFNGRKIPIITDNILVDMSFGTGAVKVTPAHDHNDYLCGKRNNLEFIIMLTDDGKIINSSTIAGQFSGMMRYDARIAMEEEMKKLGLFRGKVMNAMRLGLCSRTNDIIEPMLTPQWYVNCSNMAKRSVDAVRNGDLKILPAVHESTWYMWLENIRDWCISRQLWWGHRIPAYFVRLPGETKETMDQNDTANSERWFVGRTEDEARTKAATKLGVSAASLSLTQDEDVLDTWFSSGLFPFSVFGWPDETPDLKAFFPTTV